MGKTTDYIEALGQGRTQKAVDTGELLWSPDMLNAEKGMESILPRLGSGTRPARMTKWAEGVLPDIPQVYGGPLNAGVTGLVTQPTEGGGSVSATPELISEALRAKEAADGPQTQWELDNAAAVEAAKWSGQ